jgi:hypothetical protein
VRGPSFVQEIAVAQFGMVGKNVDHISVARNGVVETFTCPTEPHTESKWP